MSAHNQNTKSSVDAASEHLNRAVKLDPHYGMAWVGLADNFGLRADNAFMDATEGYGRMRELAEHALLVSPDLAEPHTQLAYAHRVLDRDWAAAETELQRALAIDHTDPDTLLIAGILAFTVGRSDDAERQFRAALVRDPRNPWLFWNLGTTYFLAGRYQEAEATFRRVLEVEPSFGWSRTSLGKTLLAQGKPEAALAMVQENTDEAERLVFLPIVLQALGRESEADEALKEQITHWADTGGCFVAQTYAHRGDHDRAMEWLERAYEQKEVCLLEIVGEPMLEGLADDPRYKAFLRKMNLPVPDG